MIFNGNSDVGEIRTSCHSFDWFCFKSNIMIQKLKWKGQLKFWASVHNHSDFHWVKLISRCFTKASKMTSHLWQPAPGTGQVVTRRGAGCHKMRSWDYFLSHSHIFQRIQVEFAPHSFQNILKQSWKFESSNCDTFGDTQRQTSHAHVVY